VAGSPRHAGGGISMQLHEAGVCQDGAQANRWKCGGLKLTWCNGLRFCKTAKPTRASTTVDCGL
jgi:hypothetical protein